MRGDGGRCSKAVFALQLVQPWSLGWVGEDTAQWCPVLRQPPAPAVGTEVPGAPGGRRGGCKGVLLRDPVVG